MASRFLQSGRAHFTNRKITTAQRLGFKKPFNNNDENNKNNGHISLMNIIHYNNEVNNKKNEINKMTRYI